ncbi:uncharacterized protein LOC125671832 [Ostrea edulis]|uniref:uncharacterized protein LOC125671832 n=1 Tax=Ostrea edulis TaxID=37623 RepID=UPI0024AF2A57|nr:uncharacterized protein LOC125671832 [Ostrea edulis]
MITDYASTHIIFDYVNVSIKYRGSNVGIGFNNGTLVRNPYSLSPSTHQMSTQIGNTGLFGLWFYTVTQDTRKEEVYVTDVVGIVLGVLLAVVSIISVVLCVIAAHFRTQR